nr:hypothetical protein [uncultured Rhodopila sp.]
MDLRTLIGTLIEAADKDADTLDELCGEASGDDTRENYEAYRAELDDTNAAIEAGREWLAGLAPEWPARIIIDMTGGLFNGAFSTTPAEVLVIDSDDPEHPRADVPGFGNEIWAGLEDAEVDPDVVNAAFDGIAWIDRDKAEGGEGEIHAKPLVAGSIVDSAVLRAGADAPADTPGKVLAEFISDVEAVGLETVKQEWPDLAATFAKARAALAEHAERHLRS